MTNRMHFTPNQQGFHLVFRGFIPGLVLATVSTLIWWQYDKIHAAQKYYKSESHGHHDDHHQFDKPLQSAYRIKVSLLSIYFAQMNIDWKYDIHSLNFTLFQRRHGIGVNKLHGKASYHFSSNLKFVLSHLGRKLYSSFVTFPPSNHGFIINDTCKKYYKLPGKIIEYYLKSYLLNLVLRRQIPQHHLLEANRSLGFGEG